MVNQVWTSLSRRGEELSARTRARMRTHPHTHTTLSFRVVSGTPWGPGAIRVGSRKRGRIWTQRKGKDALPGEAGSGKDIKVNTSESQGGLGFLEFRVHEGKEKSGRVRKGFKDARTIDLSALVNSESLRFLDGGVKWFMEI